MGRVVWDRQQWVSVFRRGHRRRHPRRRIGPPTRRVCSLGACSGLARPRPGSGRRPRAGSPVARPRAPTGPRGPPGPLWAGLAGSGEWSFRPGNGPRGRAGRGGSGIARAGGPGDPRVGAGAGRRECRAPAGRVSTGVEALARPAPPRAHPGRVLCGGPNRRRRPPSRDRLNRAGRSQRCVSRTGVLPVGVAGSSGFRAEASVYGPP